MLFSVTVIRNIFHRFHTNVDSLTRDVENMGRSSDFSLFLAENPVENENSRKKEKAWSKGEDLLQKNFKKVFGVSGGLSSKGPLTAPFRYFCISLINSLISTLKTASVLSFLSTVSREDMTVEWSRLKILPIFG